MRKSVVKRRPWRPCCSAPPWPGASSRHAPRRGTRIKQGPAGKVEAGRDAGKALHDNPDVPLAAAKLAEAEAELNRARLLAVQNVAAQYQAIEAQQAAVQIAAAELERMKQLVAQKAVETKVVDARSKSSSTPKPNWRAWKLNCRTSWASRRGGDGRENRTCWLEGRTLSSRSKAATSKCCGVGTWTWPAACRRRPNWPPDESPRCKAPRPTAFAPRWTSRLPSIARRSRWRTSSAK